jgi:hypothetical protein
MTFNAPVMGVELMGTEGDRRGRWRRFTLGMDVRRPEDELGGGASTSVTAVRCVSRKGTRHMHGSTGPDWAERWANFGGNERKLKWAAQGVGQSQEWAT